MSGLFSGSNQVNDTTAPATSLRIQTSVAGKAIAIVVGQVRLAPNLIDAQDFSSVVVNTGGGGGGGGKGGGSSCIGLEAAIAAPDGDKPLGDIVVGDVIWSQHPITGVLERGIVKQVIDHDMALSPDGMLSVHFVGCRVPLPITTNHYPWIDGICRREMQHWNIGEEMIHIDRAPAAISSIAAVEKPARTRNLIVEPHHNFFACGVLLHNGFGGGGGKGSTETDYFVAPVYGVCEGPIAEFVQIWNGQTPATLASLNLASFVGDYPGTQWGYMAALHPANALGYPGLATMEAGTMALGTSPNLPNINAEVLAAINSAIPGLPDADPALWIADLLTNQYYGAVYPSARLGDLSAYSTFCKANGLVVSDALTDQRALNDYLKDLLEGTYAEFVVVDGDLTIVPRGMQAVAGNGSIYTPPGVDYTLAIDDFLPNTNATGTSSASTALSNDPVIWSVTRRDELPNQITVQCYDRTYSAYNPNPQMAQNLAATQAYGLRAIDPKQYSFFCSTAAALTSAHYQLEEAQIDKTCCFTLGMKHCRVRPMCLLAGVPLPCGMGTTTVRVTEITQNQDFTLSITAEEYPVGGIAPQQYNSENPNPSAPGIDTDPGPVNAPIVFAPPAAIAGNQGLEAWCLASGSIPALFGGCDICIASAVGGPYQKSATLKGSSRMGVTTADFRAGADPDIIDTLNVDLSMSAGTLDAGTWADADQANTLCLVRGPNGDEYVSFSTAILTGANAYALGNYLRRGQYGTAIVDHPSGSAFGRIDQNVARIPYQASQIGQTVWLKLLAFNKFGGGGEELGDVTAYEVTLPAPPAPPDVTGFGAQQNGNVVAFAWDSVDYPAVALAGYLLGYAPAGTADWSKFTLLTEAAAGTEMTNADVPPGTWVFGIRAASIAYAPGSSSAIGLSPDIATVDLVVGNTQPVISAVDAAPLWSIATYADLGNFTDAPAIAVDLGAYHGLSPLVTAVTDLGSFST